MSSASSTQQQCTTFCTDFVTCMAVNPNGGAAVFGSVNDINTKIDQCVSMCVTGSTASTASSGSNNNETALYSCAANPNAQAKIYNSTVPRVPVANPLPANMTETQAIAQSSQETLNNICKNFFTNVSTTCPSLLQYR